MRTIGLLLMVVLAFTLHGQATASPQPLADRTSDWLTEVLGVEVPYQQVGVLDSHEYPSWTAASFPTHEGPRFILAKPRWHGEWSGRPGLRGGHLLIHELLHGLSEDEGAVDTLAIDLVPAWAARFAPRLSVDAWIYSLDVSNAAYPTLVRNVRGRSAAETGTSWRSRDSRLWRRAWVLETGR